MDNREQADNFYKSGKWAEAIEMYAKCKGDAVSFMNRSDCYLNMGEFDRALVDAKVALTLDGSSPKAHYRLGRALYYQGKVEDAQKTCSDALISHPDDKALHQLLHSCDLKLRGIEEPDVMVHIKAAQHDHVHEHGHGHSHEHGSCGSHDSGHTHSDACGGHKHEEGAAPACEHGHGHAHGHAYDKPNEKAAAPACEHEHGHSHSLAHAGKHGHEHEHEKAVCGHDHAHGHVHSAACEEEHEHEHGHEHGRLHAKRGP